MKILVFSIQYDFQILKYQYQYSIWRILNKYQYQYVKKTEVSVFSISILSVKLCKKASKTKQIWKIGVNLSFIELTLASKSRWFNDFYYKKHGLKPRWSLFWRIYIWFIVMRSLKINIKILILTRKIILKYQYFSTFLK